MPPLKRRLTLLQGEPPGAVAAILAGAIPGAEPGEREALCEAALATGLPDALAAVIGCLHEVGPAVLTRLCRPDLRLRAAVAAVRRAGDRRALLNALALAQRRADVELIEHVVDLLSYSKDGVGPQAARSLLAITVALVGRDGRRRLHPAVEDRIDRAALRAVSSYPDHRRRDALLVGALLSTRRGTRMARALSDRENPILFALRGVAARTGEPLVRRNLLRWATTDLLGPQALRQLHRAAEGPGIADVLADGHLVRAPHRRRALKRVESPTRCAPELRRTLSCPEPVQAHVVRLIRTLPLTPQARCERLADCAALTGTLARLDALQGLLEEDSSEARRSTEKMCFDPVGPIAYLASRRVLGRPMPRETELLRRLRRSPHRVVARRAIGASAALGVDAYFRSWLALDRNRRWALGLRLLGDERRAMLNRLTDIVSDGDREAQLAGITLVRRLGLTAELERHVIGAACGIDHHVASAAVAALGDAGTAGRREVLMGALGHDDGRVRANAVEALMRIDRRQTGHLGPLVDSRDPRLRANAVRAMMRGSHATGRQALQAMLGDADPRHRVSGVWVAGRCRSRFVAADLRRLTRSDRLVEVRTRAAATIQLLDHQQIAAGAA